LLDLICSIVEKSEAVEVEVEVEVELFPADAGMVGNPPIFNARACCVQSASYPAALKKL
jgi:hypothetical protein